MEVDLPKLRKLAKLEELLISHDIFYLQNTFSKQLKHHCEYALRSDGERIDIITSDLISEDRGRSNESLGIIDSYINILLRRGVGVEDVEATCELAKLAHDRVLVKLPVAGNVESGELYVQDLRVADVIEFHSDHGTSFTIKSQLEDIATGLELSKLTGLSVKPGTEPNYSCIFQIRDDDKIRPQEIMDVLGYSSKEVSIASDLYDAFYSHDKEGYYASIGLHGSEKDPVVKFDYPNIDIQIATEKISQFIKDDSCEQIRNQGSILGYRIIDYFGTVFFKSGSIESRSYYDMRHHVETRQ
ncbi:hypothetical protein Halru_2661 [Halovivax ruber XH-70]|uniref:Uncharacterized protein n=2 Tax=Halovivax ruber TaxID=387341 RepID=L0IEH5_HALRX|nr:hypothetical protein Halru_2661 [Halovivax ruber XH-70]